MTLGSYFIYFLVLLLVMLVFHLQRQEPRPGKARRLWYWPRAECRTTYQRSVAAVPIAVAIWFMVLALAPPWVGTVVSIVIPLAVMIGFEWSLIRCEWEKPVDPTPPAADVKKMAWWEKLRQPLSHTAWFKLALIAVVFATRGDASGGDIWLHIRRDHCGLARAATTRPHRRHQAPSAGDARSLCRRSSGGRARDLIAADIAGGAEGGVGYYRLPEWSEAPPDSTFVPMTLPAVPRHDSRSHRAPGD